jgi:hypothetical protein
VSHPSLRALRRTLVLVAAGGLSAIALACSQASSHPPVSGDCIGDLCPPAQSRQTGGGGGDGSADAGTGTPDANVPDAAGPDDSGNFPDVNLPDVAID